VLKHIQEEGLRNYCSHDHKITYRVKQEKRSRSTFQCFDFAFFCSDWPKIHFLFNAANMLDILPTFYSLSTLENKLVRKKNSLRSIDKLKINLELK